MRDGCQVFEAFCTQQAVAFTPIMEGALKTPDYVLDVNGHQIVAEVKTLHPNEQEALVNARRVRGEIVIGGATPGERLRRVIRSANTQLKSFSLAEQVPTIIIVMNNTGCDFHTEPYSVMTAMRGFDIIPVRIHLDPATHPTLERARSGPGRAMRSNANTSTSAVGILHAAVSGVVELFVYHNQYAKRPLAPDVLYLSQVSQFRLPHGARNSLEAPWIVV